ncbi:MAG TPA: META domain-containing protein [Geminicoccaceae bacterium]|nr:META domain-containing protein [Geminicoccaceae bacterium]
MTTRAAPAIMCGLVLLAAAAAAAAGLAGSEWRPIRIGVAAVADDAQIIVQFRSDGRLAGHAACNRFTGSYALAGNSIEIAPVAATRMVCPEPVMQQERLFLEVLERARGFARNRTDLTLIGSQGDVTAFFVQTDWD